MSEEIITDFLGVPIGRFKTEGTRTEVTDWYGRPLGSADENGTRDFLGVPISNQNVPGLLFNPTYNPSLKSRAEDDARQELRQRDGEESARAFEEKVEKDEHKEDERNRQQSESTKKQWREADAKRPQQSDAELMRDAISKYDKEWEEKKRYQV